MVNIYSSFTIQTPEPILQRKDTEIELYFWTWFFLRNELSADVQTYLTKLSTDYDLDWIWNMFQRVCETIQLQYSIRHIDIVKIHGSRISICFRCYNLLEHKPG